MRISVVVPFRDAERHIGRCLTALAEQAPVRGGYEVLAIDDHSSDRSAAIAASAPGVRLLRSDGHGPYAARNAGIRESDGDVVAFTDADCEPARDWVRTIAWEFESEETAIVIGPRLPADEPRLALVSTYERTKDAYVFGCRRTQLYYASAQNMAVRRSAFDRLGTFRERRRGSDTLLVRRAIAAGAAGGVRYAPHLVVRHLEIDGLLHYYGKCLVYGRSIGSLDRGLGRPLTWRERLLVWREATRSEQLSSARSLTLLATLGAGAACWGIGYVGARLVPLERP